MDMTFTPTTKPLETPPPSPDPSLSSLDRRRGTGCCAKGLSSHRRFLVGKVIALLMSSKNTVPFPLGS